MKKQKENNKINCIDLQINSFKIKPFRTISLSTLLLIIVGFFISKVNGVGIIGLVFIGTFISDWLNEYEVNKWLDNDMKPEVKMKDKLE
jgi:hypothetical protein